MAKAYGSSVFATECGGCGKTVERPLHSESAINTAAIWIECSRCGTINWAESNLGDSK
jgi:endogenous inhibitor of DNA gyrase (YacG/DUF329 family)